MHAAVLHTIGTVPRYEEFAEPVIDDKDDQVVVHVHAASLKPVDKQLASGSHYASRRELPCVCGSDGVGHLDNGQRVFFGGPRPPHGAMRLPPPCPTLVFQRGFHWSTAQSWCAVKTSSSSGRRG